MVNGIDIAKFVSQQLGEDFVSLYKEGEQEEQRLQEEEAKFKKLFQENLKRLNNAR